MRHPTQSLGPESTQQLIVDEQRGNRQALPYDKGFAMTTRNNKPALQPPSLNARIRTMDLAPAKCSVAMEFGWPRRRIERAAGDFLDFFELIGSGTLDVCAVSADGDRIWHAALLNSRTYMHDCHALFGRYIHHDAWVGHFGLKDARQQQARYRQSQRAIAALRRLKKRV